MFCGVLLFVLGVFFPFFSTFPSPWRHLPPSELRSRWDPKEWVLGSTKASEAPDKTPSLGGKISNSRCGTGTPLPKVLFPTLSLTKPSLFLKPPEPNRPGFCTSCVLLVFALCFWMTAWCEAALFSGKQSCHCLVHMQLLPEPWKLHVASLLHPDNSTSIAWAII